MKHLKKLFLALIFSMFAAFNLQASPLHKVVIQVSTDDARTQKIALNNAVNLQKLYGMDNVVIEVVAYGPGLSILTKNYPDSKRVASLAMQDIKGHL